MLSTGSPDLLSYGLEVHTRIWHLQENVISAKTHLYHTDNNPYEGFKLHGDIDSVYLRGAHVVQDGKVILEKTGKYIKRGNKQ